MTQEEADEAIAVLHNDLWFLELPENVKEVVRRFPPIFLYRFKDTKKQFYIVSFNEEDPDDPNGKITLKVQKIGIGGVLSQLGLGKLDRNEVFGVELDSIERVPNEDIPDEFGELKLI